MLPILKPRVLSDLLHLLSAFLKFVNWIISGFLQILSNIIVLYIPACTQLFQGRQILFILLQICRGEEGAMISGCQ